MSIGLFNAQYKLGIDTTTLKQVSNEILKRAAEKNSQYNTNTSSLNNIFKNTNNIGIDLYSGKVDTNVARQVAMNNSGFQIQLNQEVMQSIQYLNTKAAQNVQKHAFNSIISLGAGKDKNGSAPSYKGEFLFIKKDKENEEAVAA